MSFWDAVILGTFLLVLAGVVLYNGVVNRDNRNACIERGGVFLDDVCLRSDAILR